MLGENQDFSVLVIFQCRPQILKLTLGPACVNGSRQFDEFVNVVNFFCQIRC